jgi:putative transcriptional regulator
MEFFKYRNTTKPGKGKVLVSEPYLPDPNFERTIILLCEHNDEGSFGFVLNKPSMAKIGDVMEDLKNMETPVFVGGPVQQDTLHFIHQCAELEGAVEISTGIFWGGDFEELIVKLDTRQVDIEDVKFFLGYSGWSAGQLEEELKADSWIVSSHVNRELIFQTSHHEMWQKALKIMGGRFSVYSNYPLDPNLN